MNEQQLNQNLPGPPEAITANDEYLQKVEAENAENASAIKMLLADVKELESCNAELLAKLKNTQMLLDKANKDLAKAEGRE